MLWKRLLVCVAVFAMIGDAEGGGRQANLLRNGGFEKDSNGDGVADGWIAQDLNFSRQTPEEVQAYIDGLPAHEKLLDGESILGADGAVLHKRQPVGSWGADVLGPDRWWGDNEKSWKPEENWYARLRDESLWRHSRFGEPPIPEGLELGETTLVLSSQRPHRQVVSEPIEVAPDTGYRLSFWVRTSGGAEYWWGPQILDGGADPAEVAASPQPGVHYNDPRVVNSIPASFWWGGGIAGRYWARMELPFRTGPECTSIVIRLPYNHRDDAERRRMHNENYRISYDDLRLTEDPTVLGAGPTEEGRGQASAPEWPAEAVKRGFVAAPRPAFPVTFGGYVPSVQETKEPLRLTLSTGETDSAVIFVRAVGSAVTVSARPGTLVSKDGYGIANGYGARAITIRAAEMADRFLTSKRFVRTPKFLLNSSKLSIPKGQSGQFWVTATVPPGTPPGEYAGEIKITNTKTHDGGENKDALSLPVVLTVRDMELEEADAAFFTWYHTAPVPTKSPMGPSYALPGSDEIYLADQRRHGMNTVAAYCQAERKDADGGFHVTFNELDSMVTNVQRAGLCLTHPLLLYAWRDDGEGGEFCEFAGGENTVMAIAQHAQSAGWPELLFGVLDEPASENRSARVEEVIITQYMNPRKRGVRTTTASGRFGVFTRPLGPDGRTVGNLYDVWIEAMYGGAWPEMYEAAAGQDAELWMYNCWITGAGYLQERFYAGLWTWRTGAKGNGVWSYGWYVRINESGLPESKIAWEGRLAGVNDYRYLRTLEKTIAAGDDSGKAGPSVRNAKEFLANLRQRIPYSTYRQRPGAIPQNQWAEMDAWNPAPEFRDEDYVGIRDKCVDHINAIRDECDLPVSQ
jgi:hypothetical protein